MWKNNMSSRFLLIGFCSILILYCLQFLWKRRKLYQSSFSLPGPFALPLIGSALNFVGSPYDIFTKIMQLFHTYPGLFRIWFGTRMFYAVSDPKMIEILLTNPNALRKENLYRMMEPVIGQGLLSARSVTHWKKNRKLIMPTFNQKILDGFTEIFAEHSESLVDLLKQYSSKGEFDIFQLLSNCTLDIISETAMGVKINAQSYASNFPKWTDKIMEIVMIRIFNILYHNDRIFYNSKLGRAFWESTNNVRSFTKKVLLEKRELRQNNRHNQEYMDSTLKRTAFLDLLLDIDQFSDEELLNETVTFMIAGSDTTAVSNCFALTMLGLHKEIQETVLEEILDVVGPSDKVNLTHLPQLKYLERVIKESLRLFPVAPIVVRTTDKDINLGDHVLHKGCSVVIGILRTHTNEQYWPNPYRFDPDRFLPEEVAKRTPGSYLPFSYGPRNCIGMKYAMMAMKTLLATVVRKYRLFTSYKSVQDIELKTNLVLRPKDGFKLSLELR